MSAIAERIKILRVKNNLTQKQLSEILSVQPFSVQRFEYGTVRPSLDTLVAIAEYFNVSIDYLVGLTDKPERNK